MSRDHLKMGSYGTLIFFSALGMLITGCPEEAAPEPEAPLGECRKNLDCGAGAVCQKLDEADEWGVCLKLVCTSDSDCEEGEICETRRGICIPGNTCDPANPQEVCEPGQVCVYVEGVPVCQDASTLTPPDACTISPDHLFVATGATTELSVTGFFNSGAMAPNSDFTLTAEEGVTISGHTITTTCTETHSCSYTVTASALAGDASCTSTVTVFPQVPAADFRVVALDAQNNKTLTASKVVIQLSDGTLDAQNTGTDGSYTWTGKASEVTAVSLFDNDYHWQTFIAPDSNDVAIFTRPVPKPTKASGIKGRFNYDNVQSLGEVKMAIAGTPLNGDLTALDFNLVLGELSSVPVDIDAVYNGNLLMPSSFAFEISDEPMKDYFVVFGPEGPSTLWGLGGHLKLADVGGIISEVAVANVDDVNIGSVLASVLPFFNTFNHAVVTGLELEETNRPTTPASGSAIPYNSWTGLLEFDDEDALDLNTLLTQSITYDIPTIPCAPGQSQGPTCIEDQFTTGVVLASGTIVPGQGIVPLGLTLGLDDPDSDDNIDQGDGTIEYLPGTAGAPNAGQMIVDAAPQHDGLEGNLLTSLAFALDINSVVGGNLSVSVLVHIDSAFDTVNSFPADKFLQYQTGTYNKQTTKVSLSVLGGADFYNIKGKDSTDGYWNVWFKDPTQEIDLNALRTSAETSAYYDRDWEIDIQAIKIGNGYPGRTPSNFDELIQFNGTNLDKMNYFIGAWSSVTCAPEEQGVPSSACIELSQSE